MSPEPVLNDEQQQNPMILSEIDIAVYQVNSPLQLNPNTKSSAIHRATLQHTGKQIKHNDNCPRHVCKLIRIIFY